jgi:hypothetical protein
MYLSAIILLLENNINRNDKKIRGQNKMFTFLA